MPWPRNVPDALSERKAKVSNAASPACAKPELRFGEGRPGAADQSVPLGAESDVDAVVNRRTAIWVDQ